MPKQRIRFPRTLEKRVFQEAGSKCAFCPECEVVALKIHHIDADPANNVFDNLVLVCATCHAKITRGVISAETVRLKKQQLAQPGKSASKPITSVEGIHVGPTAVRAAQAFTTRHEDVATLTRPNQPLERTADRCEDLLSMTSTLKPEAQLTVVSGRSACSR